MPAQKSHLQVLLATLLASGLTIAAPANKTVHLAKYANTTACHTQMVHKPLLYNLDPTSPDTPASGPVSAMHLSARDGESTREQLVVFPSMPSGARACKLGWTQSSAAARDFLVNGTGLVDIYTLMGNFNSEAAAGLATPAWIDARLKGGEHMQADFTGWDGAANNATMHVAGPIKCSAGSDLAVKTKVSPTELGSHDGMGDVSMMEDGLNGWTLTYEMC